MIESMPRIPRLAIERQMSLVDTLDHILEWINSRISDVERDEDLSERSKLSLNRWEEGRVAAFEQARGWLCREIKAILFDLLLEHRRAMIILARVGDFEAFTCLDSDEIAVMDTIKDIAIDRDDLRMFKTVNCTIVIERKYTERE